MISYSGIDPHAPRLRELYRTAGSLKVAGALDGALAIVEGDAGAATNAALVCLSAPGKTTRIPIRLPSSRHIAARDAIRDHRLLLVGENTDGLQARNPSGVAVEILDLDTGARRRLGHFPGGGHEEVLWSDIDLPWLVNAHPPRVNVATESLNY